MPLGKRTKDPVCRGDAERLGHGPSLPMNKLLSITRFFQPRHRPVHLGQKTRSENR